MKNLSVVSVLAALSIVTLGFASAAETPTQKALGIGGLFFRVP